MELYSHHQPEVYCVVDAGGSLIMYLGSKRAKNEADKKLESTSLDFNINF